jgi:hypothetical protein
MLSAAPNPFDDVPVPPSIAPKSSPTSSFTTKGSSGAGGGGGGRTVDKRARAAAVSRLVADAIRPPDFLLDGGLGTAAAGGAEDLLLASSYTKDEEYANHARLESAKADARLRSKQHSTLLLASTVASSIERGLDKELHAELVHQGREAQSVIGKICHDHSDDFLESVGKVVTALGGPCDEVKNSLEEVRESYIPFLFHVYDI